MRGRDDHGLPVRVRRRARTAFLVRSALEPPVASSGELLGLVLGSLWVASGLLALLTLVLAGSAGSTGSTGTPACAVAVVAAVGGGVLWVCRRRLPRAVYRAAVLLSTAMVTSFVVLAPSGSFVAAGAMFAVLAAAVVGILLSPAEALGHLVLIVAGLLWSLGERGVDQPAALLMVGVVTLAATTNAVLVQRTARTAVDPLTGLPDRRGLERRLETVLTADAGEVAVVVLDVDDLAGINARGGVRAGDTVLAEAARRWRYALPVGATIARSGGDEFAVLLPGAGGAEAEAVARQLQLACSWGGSVCAGVAEAEPEDSASALLDRACSALVVAKRGGPGRHHRHPGTRSEVLAVRRGLARGEYRVVYQPIVCPAAGVAVGAEALLRWDAPGRGPVPPLEFLPAAELSGAVVDLGRWVVREACAAAATWGAGPARATAPFVSVNVSARELMEPGYVDGVRETLAQTGLPPSRLLVEVLESDQAADDPVAAATLAGLRAAGVRVAVDDFGTGYSTLHRLASLEVDVVKLDKSFVDPVVDSVSVVPLTSSVLSLVRALGLQVVVEGVETAGQADWLRADGTCLVQGFHYARPQAAAEVSARWFSAGGRAAATSDVTALPTSPRAQDRSLTVVP